jgi:hypothetical protein
MMCGETPASASNVVPPMHMDCPTIDVSNRVRRRVIKNKHVGTVPSSMSQSSRLKGKSESRDLRYVRKGLLECLSVG